MQLLLACAEKERERVDAIFDFVPLVEALQWSLGLGLGLELRLGLDQVFLVMVRFRVRVRVRARSSFFSYG